MRNTITRTITTTTIRAAIVEFENGAPVAKELEPIAVHGNVSKTDAKKIAAKKYGKHNNVVVIAVDTSEKCYEISVADFVKYAKPVDEPADTDTETA